MALSQTANTVTRIGGAVLAGLLLEFSNYSVIYGTMAAIYAAAAIAALLIRSDIGEPATRPRSQPSLLSQVGEGLRWAYRTRRPMAVVGVSVLMFIFIVPYQGVFLPLLVIDELAAHASWVGYMMAAGGAGAVAGSLTLAAVRRLPATGRLMASLLNRLGHRAGAALVRAQPAAGRGLRVRGGRLQHQVMSLANLTLLRLGRGAMAGRAVSLMNLARGMIPVGAMIAGALADGLGPRTGLLTVSVAAIAVSALVLISPLAGQVSDQTRDEPAAP